MTRIIAICGLIVGLAALGYAVLLFCEHPEQPHTVESGTVVVEGAELGEVGLQSIVPAYIRIHNNSNVAIRFIGGPNGCQPGGCMKTTGQCPLTIDANAWIVSTQRVRVSRHCRSGGRKNCLSHWQRYSG